MFALMMSEDRISMQEKRKGIIQAMNQLPGAFLLDTDKITIMQPWNKTISDVVVGILSWM